MASVSLNGRGQIGINAHLLSGREGYRRAGIHHYIAQLLKSLPQIEPGLRFTVFANHAADLNARLVTNLVTTPWPTHKPLMRIVWEQAALPVAAARRKLDLLHSMAFVAPILSPCPVVVTVYDLSFLHYPDRFPKLQRLYLTSQTRRSCRTARRVVTISESGRKDVHASYDVPLDRIDVIRPGVDESFCPRPPAEVEAFRQREQLPSQFILHVGTLQPRKNLSILVEAYGRLKRPETGLVFVGGKGWYYEDIISQVKELSLENRVRFTGYVPDADLPLWYNAAEVLVFPSVYEGFGMPVAQAMACGTPVIAADTSAIPEVSGGAARLFDAHDVTALADHMAFVLDDPQVAATMREQGLLQAQQFSWRNAGREMVSVYRRALEGK